ncbi:HAMP domain-containing protein [Bradyrhizobium sp. NBAIM20]|uniref:adenylate/guanylate cyclase domain-containing protein n=1 Tax=unclassified Bradyrhizobium TaxID=2631580 RepID=UPI001CD8036B|nr:MULTISPECIES: adenylate/guanylate cyclase domain-containing protein [unclassified Bradyrhizobium]MCA1416175.1 HAMP domain-containing protein [Bradyrhizobium sp. NBAIM20]MCA1459983.1 HAMP domain-containing protein [Bradyrhizobium sp. NBAIM18]
MTDGAAQSSSCKMPQRRSLFCKYFATLFVAAVVPLILGAAVEASFGYRDQRRQISAVLQADARAASDRIEAFSEGIRDQLGWMVQLPWAAGGDAQHKIDALRLLQQVPAIVSVSLLDETGTERVFVSRLHLNRTGRGIDMSEDPAVLGARANKVWYGPVQYQRDSEPYMRIAVAGSLPAAGVAIAEVNLKLIWDVIAAIRIGETGYAIVVDNSGHLIAHPDISLVLRGRASSGSFGRIKHLVGAASGAAVITGDQGNQVVALSVQAADVGWTVIAMLPTSEAFASIRAALWRSSILIAFGVLVALALAYWRAHRMSGPIKQLEEGVERIRTGQFEHRIKIFSGDELQQLALRFNEMASELAGSQQKSARIERLKQFLPSQVAELVEHSHELLEGQRREVAVIFGDLRGFTAFSTRNEPDVIMAVMQEYYAAVGAVTTRHEATLIGFNGDGVMLLVNAPVACEQPATQAVRLAIDLQMTVQSIAGKWCDAGHAIGFGVGVAMGPATVGTVGYNGRLNYTAMGAVVNLASRLCDLAKDAQILADPTIAGRVRDSVPLASLGQRIIKGYDQALEVFAVAPADLPSKLPGPAQRRREKEAQDH